MAKVVDAAQKNKTTFPNMALELKCYEDEIRAKRLMLKLSWLVLN